MSEQNKKTSVSRKRPAKRKKTIAMFWKVFIGYGVALAAVAVILLVVLHGLLKDFEESQPKSKMDEIVKQFTVENIDSLVKSSGSQISEFESSEVISQYFKDKIGSNSITYKKKYGEYTSSAPVYVVYAGDTALAKVSLATNGTNSHNFTVWKQDKISFDGYVSANNEVVITAPSKAEIMINGKPVGDSYKTGKEKAISACKNVKDFTEVPATVEYKVTGMLSTPTITAKLNNQDLVVTNEDGKCTVAYPTDDSLLAEQKELITKIGREYGKFIINRGSVTNLQSYMVGNAKEVVGNIEAIWAFLYGKTYTYEFKNESVTNLIKYSDDCFSCDVYFDLFVEWNNGNKTYSTNMTYAFVKIDGKWMLADFSIK